MWQPANCATSLQFFPCVSIQDLQLQLLIAGFFVSLFVSKGETCDFFGCSDLQLVSQKGAVPVSESLISKEQK